MTEKRFKSYRPSHTTAEITSLTKTVLGIDVVSMSRQDLGIINAVYFAALEDNSECVVRISPKERNWNNFEEEAWAFKKCREIGLPTPEVLALDTSLSKFPEAYMITKKLPGVNGEEANLSEVEKHKVLEQLGHFLSQIHGIHIKGFGRLKKEGSDFVGEESSLWDSIVYEFESGWWINVIAANKLLPEGKVDEIKQRFYKEQKLFSTPTSPSIIYADAALKNLLVRNSNITGILDMENIFASDPIQDFSRFHFWVKDAEGYFKSLQKGYGNQDLFDENFRKKLLMYETINVLGALAFRFEKGDLDQLDHSRSRLSELGKELELL